MGHNKEEEIRKLEAIKNGDLPPRFCNFGNHWWNDFGGEKEARIRPCPSCLDRAIWNGYVKQNYCR